MAINNDFANSKGYEVDNFVVANSTTDYDVRTNENNFSNISYRVQVTTDQTIDVKAVYHEVSTGFEIEQNAIRITRQTSPHTFPAGAIVNLLISNNSGLPANIQVINSIDNE